MLLFDKDLKLNDTELDLEILKHLNYTTNIENLTTFKLMLSKSELHTLKREKWEYYTGKADASVYAQKPFNLKILKQDVDKYLDSDVDIQRAKHKVEYLQTTTDFLDRTIRQISNRTFTIKNAIEWRKFTSGAI